MNRSFFALRRGALLTLTLTMGLALAACSTDSGTSPSAPATASEAPASGDGDATTVSISAADMAFDVNSMTATTGGPIVVTFTNNDTVPHNFSVYTEEGGEAIAQGEIINEGATDEVDLGELEPGTYYFVCDLHPEMNGTLTIEG
jgi:plastocyanin